MPTPASARRTLAAWSFALIAVTAVTAATVVMRPTIGVDVARGLVAAEQHRLGRPNALWELSVADPADLSRDHLAPITWWPPGPQDAVYWLRRTGLSIGQSAKAIALIAWTIGLGAWGVYFALALRDRTLWPWLIGLFALFRVSHASAFVYSGGDTLLWAAFPIVALLNLRSLRATGLSGLLLAATAGALSSGLVIVKYLGAILLLGFAAFWLSAIARGKSTAARLGSWLLGVCLGGALVFVNMPHALTGQTPAASQAVHYMPAMLTLAAAGPLVAMSDIIDAVTTVLNRRDLELPGYGMIGLIAAGAGVIFLAWWVFSERGLARADASEAPARAEAWSLALLLTLVTSAALAVLWWRGAVISWESRHQQYGAFLLLPFLADGIARTIRLCRSWRRLLAIACGSFFLAFPAVYGASGLANKVFVRTPALRTAFAPNGLGLYWTADGAGATAFRDEVESLPWFRLALLATPSPDIALMFPDNRLLLVLDDPAYAAHGFQGAPSGGVALLMPPWLGPATGDRIRRAFKDVHQWSRVDLTSVPGAQLWHGR